MLQCPLLLLLMLKSAAQSRLMSLATQRSISWSWRYISAERRHSAPIDDQLARHSATSRKYEVYIAWRHSAESVSLSTVQRVSDCVLLISPALPGTHSLIHSLAPTSNNSLRRSHSLCRYLHLLVVSFTESHNANVITYNEMSTSNGW